MPWSFVLLANTKSAREPVILRQIAGQRHRLVRRRRTEEDAREQAGGPADRKLPLTLRLQENQKSAELQEA